ncbi:MAG: TetR/AcrR family transcriptional regulator [Bacteroidales bacterium]|nr:TetR/AcrR family transcriptional regulator [Bacteroidales bacterium]
MTRREQILESAFNAFTSRGIKVVKMEDIAGSLKISKKTLYEFFSGKKELLVASMEYKFPKLLEKNSKIVRCMPNPLTAMVFCAVENIRFMSSFSESFVDEVRAVPELKDFGGNVKNEMDSLMNTMLSQCVREGYLKEEDSKRLVSVFMDNLRNFKELRNQDVFPSQLCFNIVITILGGLCTQKGKKVLDELKENYS